MTVPSIRGKIINRKLQLYRDISDVYHESGLISILFLSCGKHKVVQQCLHTTINSLRNYPGDLEFIFLEQGWDCEPEDAYKNVGMFNELTQDFDRSLIILPNRNGGINYGINQLWQVSRGEYVLFLESDWICTHANDQWLVHAKAILDQHKDIGIVQLRAIGDPNENWGVGKPGFSPWSCPGRPDVQERIINLDNHDFMFYVCEKRIHGVNNNPALWRKDMRRVLGPMPEPEPWSDLKHGETSYQYKFMDTGWNAAHIRIPVYYHCPLTFR